METIRPTRNVKLLLGFLAKAEVDAIFKQIPFEIRQANTDPICLWRQSSSGVSRLPHTPTLTDVRIFKDGEVPVIEEIKSGKTYKKHYESIADYQFAMVPVHLLLAPQWLADIDYIEELSLEIQPHASLDQQIRFSMAEGLITEPITIGSQVIFSSLRRDLHAEQIPSVRQLDTGEFEIVVRASSRPNYVSVVEIGGRLLLTNGVHKVCALLLKGHTHVPCVLRSISRLEESGLNINFLQSSLLRPDLLGGSRPAQVIDFLNPEIAVDVRLRSMYQVLRVGIGVEMLDVPAIPHSATAARSVADADEKTTLFLSQENVRLGVEAKAKVQ